MKGYAAAQYAYDNRTPDDDGPEPSCPECGDDTLNLDSDGDPDLCCECSDAITCRHCGGRDGTINKWRACSDCNNAMAEDAEDARQESLREDAGDEY